jgi:hypothetical protein
MIENEPEFISFFLIRCDDLIERGLKGYLL